ncbi:MAG: DnaJ domain-containing protein [Alphaproteobacteria bacterium]|nr:DnaJ domain-containing protein [Alphaproteobacteria bacterium]
MDSRNLDLADEFCKLVSKSHLLAYLGLPDDASPESAQKKLKARRKYMQGMQSNPKYKQEAIFLIKNFNALSKVLEDPIPYLKDAKRRAESQHLPVLEMTIKGVLAGGNLTHEQEDFLRRNAIELGVSENTFEDVLERLSKESGVARASASLTVTAEELKTVDFYHLLGVPRHASRDEIYARYRSKKEECNGITDPAQRESVRTKVEKAWKVLSDEATRQRYDLSWTRTGPPARNREVTRPVQASTAPPIQLRGTSPDPTPPSVPSLAPARMEVLSERVQKVPVANASVTLSIEVRNGGEMPLRGTIASDQAWLRVLSPSLKPELKQQSVKVQIVPKLIEARQANGTLTLTSESGEKVQIEVVATRKGAPVLLFALGGAGLGALVLVGVLAVTWLGASTDYVIDIDPWAEEVLLDGKSVGSGSRVVLDSPPQGEATLTVRHRNFKPWVRDVTIEPGGSYDVDLELSSRMDFKPAPSQRRANLDQRVAGEVMTHFQPRLDRCLRSGLADKPMQGVLRIHVGPDGYTTGVEIQGDGAKSPAIVECLKQQAAGPVFPPLKDGDFATVRYDYHIKPQ